MGVTSSRQFSLNGPIIAVHNLGERLRALLPFGHDLHVLRSISSKNISVQSF